MKVSVVTAVVAETEMGSHGSGEARIDWAAAAAVRCKEAVCSTTQSQRYQCASHFAILDIDLANTKRIQQFQ